MAGCGRVATIAAPMRLWLLCSVALWSGAAATAQTLEELRDVVRDNARAARYPLFVATFLGLTDESELSGGQFRIDADSDTELTVFTLPLQREWDLGENNPRLLAEANFGYATARVEVPDLWGGTVPAIATQCTADFEALAGFVGVGPQFAVGSGWQIAPLATGGIAHVQSDAVYEGPGAAFTAALADGILFNWDTTYAIYGGSVLVRNEGWQWGSTKVLPLLRYDLRRMQPIVTDDPVQDEVSTVQWVVGRLGFEGPTGWQFDDGGIDWLADVGAKVFDQRAADVLGTGHYFEIGAGLRWGCADLLPGLSGATLGGALFYGENFTGWTIGVSVTF